MSDRRERCEQLLADQATHDLNAEESRELDRLLRQNPHWRDDGFELAAAALHLALQQQLEVMPAHLRQRLKGA
jgi:hypothetical protein